MLRKEIQYEDFNGNQTSEVCYFNISKNELIEMEVEYKEGFSQLLERIIETKDNKELVRRFKEIILMSYGQKSEDGRRFIKTDSLREEFSQTAAYESLFMELCTDVDAAVTFLKGVLPKDVAVEIEKAEEEEKKKEASAIVTVSSPPTS